MFGLPDIPDAIVRGILLSLVGLGWILILVRIVGLRTLSKTTAIDFVVTLATGSLLATMVGAEGWPEFVQALVGVAMLTGWQYLFARARRDTAFKNTVENQPMLLMRDGDFVADALASVRLTEDDILSKLRQANVHDLSEVRAVVLETTGDIAILSGGASISQTLLDPVRVQ